MNLSYRLVLYVVSILFFIACNSPKKLTKKGDKYKETGFYSDAIEQYSKALNKDKTYQPAFLKLQESAQIIFNKFNTDFFQAFHSDNYKLAIDKYDEMERFVNFVSRYNVQLSIPHKYEEDYLEARAIYIEGLFTQSNNLMAEEKFDEAARLLKEIQRINPEFNPNEIAKMKEVAFLEPYYRLGINHLSHGKYRSAYNDFNHVFTKNPDYKEVKFLRDDALDKARYNVAIYNFENFDPLFGAANVIRSLVIEEIINSKNPFVRLIDRKNTEGILQEQRLTLQGVIDPNSAIRVGEILGANALLEARVIQHSHQEGELKTERKKAYHETRVRVLDPVTERHVMRNNYSKVFYHEHQKENNVSIQVQYQLVSLETGEILLSKTLSEMENSSVNYASYSGNPEQLIPGTWEFQNRTSERDQVFNNRNAVQNLRTLFSANQNPTTMDQLNNRLYQKISNQLVQDLLAFNPEKR